eukprot:scaffold9418_cov21-Tisochrysis_lutea.AAC.1
MGTLIGLVDEEQVVAVQRGHALAERGRHPRLTRRARHPVATAAVALLVAAGWRWLPLPVALLLGAELAVLGAPCERAQLRRVGRAHRALLDAEALEDLRERRSAVRCTVGTRWRSARCPPRCAPAGSRSGGPTAPWGSSRTSPAARRARRPTTRRSAPPSSTTTKYSALTLTDHPDVR